MVDIKLSTVRTIDSLSSIFVWPVFQTLLPHWGWSWLMFLGTECFDCVLVLLLSLWRPPFESPNHTCFLWGFSPHQLTHATRGLQYKYTDSISRQFYARSIGTIIGKKNGDWFFMYSCYAPINANPHHPSREIVGICKSFAKNLLLGGRAFVNPVYSKIQESVYSTTIMCFFLFFMTSNITWTEFLLLCIFASHF